ncbi:MAG: hypothetical protein ABR499_20600 [Gemmatimonadaceae bacterium]
MRRFASVTLALLLAAGIHVDWHLARPLHHRLSLDWEYHWVFAALLFAGVASLVAVRWPLGERWRAGAWVLVCGLVGAQVVEPVLTLAFYEQRLAYVVEPERWAVFFECLAAGIPAYAVALWCVGRWRVPARVA